MPQLVQRVRVEVPGAPYDVLVGPGALQLLGEEVGRLLDASCAMVVSTGPVASRYGASVRTALRDVVGRVTAVDVPDGEGAKTLATVEALYHRFAAAEVRRDDVVVALGGGVLTDLAGFAAATWYRGVALVSAPTTLLAQVDAAVGGKTGVNLPQGKNLVGAFHQPRLVVADTSVLSTLDPRDRRAGLGEVAKYGFIADPTVLDLLERNPDEAVDGDPELLAEIVRRGVAVKARIVAADEREAGERALLNYGHTVGHAIETLTGYGTYRHGEAVALGMVFAARLGEEVGVSDPGLAWRTVALLAGLGLPTGGLRVDPEAILGAMSRDKKARRGLRFVLCARPGEALVVDEPPRTAIIRVLRTLT